MERRNRNPFRASMTVEASLLMGIVLMVITLAIYLFMFVYNRAYLTCAAYEAALSGTMATACADEGAAREEAMGKASDLASGVLGSRWRVRHEASLEPALTGLRLEVRYATSLQPLFGIPAWGIDVKAQARILYPVAWIRNVKAARDLLFRRE